MNAGAIPQLGSVRAAPSATIITVAPVVQIDARYATEGTAEMLRNAAPMIAEAAVRKCRAEFPDNLRRNLRDRG